MKMFNKLLVMAVVISSFSSAAPWELLEGVVPPCKSYNYGKKINWSSFNIISEGKWNVYYEKDKWKEKIQPYGEGSLLLPAGGSAETKWHSQLAVGFQFREEDISGAELIKVSFDLNYIHPDSYASIGINIQDWFKIEQEEHLRSAASTNRSQFQLGLRNLNTQENIMANIYQSGNLISTITDYESFWYFPDDVDLVTVSFELSAAQFNSTDQFGLMLANNWLGSAVSDGDLYYMDNMRVEVLRSLDIPEPYTSILSIFGIGMLLGRRKLRH